MGIFKRRNIHIDSSTLQNNNKKLLVTCFNTQCLMTVLCVPHIFRELEYAHVQFEISRAEQNDIKIIQWVPAEDHLDLRKLCMVDMLCPSLISHLISVDVKQHVYLLFQCACVHGYLCVCVCVCVCVLECLRLE